MEEKYGEVEEMNVCDNLGDHLVGNVYVKVGGAGVPRIWGQLWWWPSPEVTPSHLACSSAGRKTPRRL